MTTKQLLPKHDDVSRTEAALVTSNSNQRTAQTAELYTSTATGKRTRLLLYTNTRLVGGMEEHIELIARHTNRDLFEVFAICPDLQTVHSFRESLTKYTDHFSAITFDYQHPTNFMALVRQIRGWRIDVMHMHNGYYRGQTLSFLAARMAGVRKIYITEHLAPQKPERPHQTIIRNTLTRLADGIICVSQKNHQARAQFLYTPPDRTFTVENGVDTDDFQQIPDTKLAAMREELNIPLDAHILGTLVRFEPEKGLEYLFDAVPMIHAKHPNSYLLMVGDGSLRSELETYAGRIGIASQVRFVGFQTEPRPYLGLMDVFVLPVPVGSMSIALLEAMAMSRAVVMTFGGEGEAVVHGKTGLCATPRDSSSIANAVNYILGDPALKEALGRAARDHVERQFSAKTTARKLEAIYQRP